MSRFNKRAVYKVILNYSGKTIEHELAPSLFKQYIDERLLIQKSCCTATVHPRYFAHIDHDTNTLRFLSVAEFVWLRGGSVALRYFLLWLYNVSRDKQGQPIYSGLYEMHNQAVAN